jgi:hypothetical protein
MLHRTSASIKSQTEVVDVGNITNLYLIKHTNGWAEQRRRT